MPNNGFLQKGRSQEPPAEYFKNAFAFVLDEVHTACGDLERIFQISFNMLAHIQNILSQLPCRVLKRNNKKGKTSAVSSNKKPALHKASAWQSDAVNLLLRLHFSLPSKLNTFRNHRI